MVAADGWRSAIHGCKDDRKNRKLDEDKRGDLKEKKEGCQVEEGEVFGW